MLFGFQRHSTRYFIEKKKQRMNVELRMIYNTPLCEPFFNLFLLFQDNFRVLKTATPWAWNINNLLKHFIEVEDNRMQLILETVLRTFSSYSRASEHALITNGEISTGLWVWWPMFVFWKTQTQRDGASQREKLYVQTFVSVVKRLALLCARLQ